VKFSEAWLRELVDPELSCEALVAQITMAGIEVDSFEAATSITEAVVVGEIVAIAAHPNADKLRVCEVNAGIEIPIQVVCGAPNARVGIKVPLARVGALLPDDLTIKATKIRGIASEGMLCAAAELQLGDDDDGLWELPDDAPVGMSLADYLGLADNIIEVDLTPNRGDCLSIRGLAREIGVLNQLPVGAIDCKPVAATLEDTLPVEIQAPQGCALCRTGCTRPRASHTDTAVDAGKASPQWHS
jgi:phenylalanyl-tRNA synthetase beta chain